MKSDKKIHCMPLYPTKMSLYIPPVLLRQSNKQPLHLILRQRWKSCSCDCLVIAEDIPHLIFELKSDFVKICRVSESYFMRTLSVMMVISGGWATLMDSLTKTEVDHKHRADSRFAPSQWETALLCNDISHWLGASLESALSANTLLGGSK